MKIIRCCRSGSLSLSLSLSLSRSVFGPLGESPRLSAWAFFIGK